MVITSLSTEGLIPSDILFAVPAVRVYFNVVVPKAVVFAEARPTVIWTSLPENAPELTVKFSELVGKVQSPDSKKLEPVMFSL